MRGGKATNTCELKAERRLLIVDRYRNWRHNGRRGAREIKLV